VPAGAAGAPAPLPAPARPAPAPGMIQADAATNSIIINAPDAIYNSLRAVVDKLDARRAQVYVEALIAEITADKAAEFGIQWQTPAIEGGRIYPVDAEGDGRLYSSNRFLLILWPPIDVPLWCRSQRRCANADRSDQHITCAKLSSGQLDHIYSIN
jgi:hypothetical protein